jgi:hypothetical protein
VLPSRSFHSIIFLTNVTIKSIRFISKRKKAVNAQAQTALPTKQLVIYFFFFLAFFLAVFFFAVFFFFAMLRPPCNKKLINKRI